MDRDLALEAVRVTEAAALAASRWMGRGDERAADAAAAEAMRSALDDLRIEGKIVIGEGEEGEAPLLYRGETVGSGGPQVDIALDPLEGTTTTALGSNNAMAVVAMAETGGFLSTPEVYMDKIAVGAGLPPGIVHLDRAPKENLEALAEAKNKEVADIVVCVLDRPRHQKLISGIREAGARIMQIRDGDVGAVIATAQRASGIDIYLGSGGAPEGVLAAAALQGVGGRMQGRLIVRNDDERERLRRWHIEDFDRLYELDALARSPVMFAATGVTDGTMLRGVRREGSSATTHSIVMRSQSGTVREIETRHDFARKAGFD